MILLRLIIIGLTSSNHLEGKFDPRVKPWRDMPRSVAFNLYVFGKTSSGAQKRKDKQNEQPEKSG